MGKSKKVRSDSTDPIAKKRKKSASAQPEPTPKAADKAEKKSGEKPGKQSKKTKNAKKSKKHDKVAARVKAVEQTEDRVSRGADQVEVIAPARKTGSVSDALRLPAGPVSLASLDPRATPAIDGDKEGAEAAMAGLGEQLAELQERLFAGRHASEQRILLILQGMDTSGKGGVLRHSVALIDPQGVSITSFKAPTPEERRHDFLWRIRNALPGSGMVGVFDRSHYEDVLIARVRELAPRATIGRRYATINRFEARLAEQGYTVIKCMLHISAEEQKERLQARLEDPTKHWKYNPGDLDERAMWPDYQEAYEIALTKTNTEVAPWYVIPSDRKWYRNWAIATILLEHLEALNLSWPEADFDVAGELARLLDEDPLA